MTLSTFDVPTAAAVFAPQSGQEFFMLNRHAACASSNNSSSRRALGQTGTVIAIAGTVLFSTQAEAYLDPGTGSMILQGIVAGVAAAFAYAGMYWQRVKDLFGRWRKDSSVEKADDDQTPQ